MKEKLINLTDIISIFKT